MGEELLLMDQQKKWFLFSEFVSWTIIDYGEPPTAPRVASVSNNMESRPWGTEET